MKGGKNVEAHPLMFWMIKCCLASNFVHECVFTDCVWHVSTASDEYAYMCMVVTTLMFACISFIGKWWNAMVSKRDYVFVCLLAMCVYVVHLFVCAYNWPLYLFSYGHQTNSAAVLQTLMHLWRHYLLLENLLSLFSSFRQTGRRNREPGLNNKAHTSCMLVM